MKHQTALLLIYAAGVVIVAAITRYFMLAAFRTANKQFFYYGDLDMSVNSSQEKEAYLSDVENISMY